MSRCVIVSIFYREKKETRDHMERRVHKDYL